MKIQTLSFEMKIKPIRLYCSILAVVILTGFDSPAQSSSAATGAVVKTKCGSDMVAIPAGQFTMGFKSGAIDAKPEHAVKVDGFFMDQHEIPQEIYEAVTSKNPSRVKSPKNPVEQVTWSAAARFCNARSLQEGLTPCYDTNTWECNFSVTGYRLPTEAEWEYACRAGSTTEYCFGDNEDGLAEYAWYGGDIRGSAHPVGEKKPNVWGLYDMHGNVWEWCADWYGGYTAGAVTDPQGPTTVPTRGDHRVMRGGSFFNAAASCRSTNRMGCTPNGHNGDYGFRVVVSAP